MSTYANLPAPSPEQGLNRYLQEIRKFPMLEPEEEYMLAKRWVEDGDTAAAHKMVTSHLRLAAKIAMGYRGYGLPQAEVISEANVGPDAGGQEIRPRKGLPPCHLCDVVDPRLDPGICPAVVVDGETGHHQRRRRSCSSTCARPRPASARWKRATCAPRTSPASPMTSA